MEEQLSFELDNLSSGKRRNPSSLNKHLSSKKKQKAKLYNQREQLVSQLLPKTKKETTKKLHWVLIFFLWKK